MTGQGVRPRILVTGEKRDGLRSVAEVRESLRDGHAKTLWEALLREAEADLKREPYDPFSMCPERDATSREMGIRDFVIVNATCMRIERAALACLLTGETRFRDEALRQMDAVFDARKWPSWPDQAHMGGGAEADLRTGQFLQAFCYAYDWLHCALTPSERRWIVENLDRRAIRPYWREVARKAWWSLPGKPNNWQTCVVGGAGIAGMGLAEDHPESEKLVALSLPLMEAYLDVLGPEGEFNESVFYAASLRHPVAYFAAHRYHTGGAANLVGAPRFVAACRWYLYLTLPPGRVAGFGDCDLEAPPDLLSFLAVAAACDGILQWSYLTHWRRNPANDLALELLLYDPTVEPESPEGTLPRGRAFKALGATWSSRADWEPRRNVCVVYGKGGDGNEVHGHHDAGTVCIDAHGKRLIVDIGSPYYPSDYFGPNRWEYYPASVRGHNVLVLGQREMRKGEADRAEIVAARFGDAVGGYWIGDMTALYDGVRRVRRAVVHLLPGVVAVYDEALLEAEEAISLRWHTIDRCEPDATGRFVVVNDDVRLVGRILRLDSGPVTFGRGEHEYRPPFDKDRRGVPLESERESYVEARLFGQSCRLLTLFAVFGVGERTEDWADGPFGWTVVTPGGQAVVSVEENAMSVRGPRGTLRCALESDGCQVLRPKA